MEPYDESFLRRFWSHVRKGGANVCWEWLGCKSEKGYGQITVKGNIKAKAHRVSWEAANKACIPSGMIVMHLCDNPNCVNPAHLRLGTLLDNCRDMWNKGRQSKLSVANRKISDHTVRKIIELKKNGMGDKDISVYLGCNYRAVYKITHGLTYKDVVAQLQNI